ncbi:hypothetical protein Q3G72_019227 [Acer saccharum]|nr:hypothetical protein Q3G72_019227 [Acer saccharum]
MLGMVKETETLRQLLEVTVTPVVVEMLGVVEETEMLLQLLELTEALRRIGDEPRPRSVFDDLQPIILLWYTLKEEREGVVEETETLRQLLEVMATPVVVAMLGGGRGDGDATATPRSD